MQTRFTRIYERAVERKGGEEALERLLSAPLSVEKLRERPDHRYLAQMTRCVFNAGFHWRVISQKWPDFEEAFHGFELEKLLSQAPDEWEAYLADERIVRNWQKIQTVFSNAVMIAEIAEEHGSFAAFFAEYPPTQQVELMRFLKQSGARLGGNTGQYVIRFSGKDGFILSRDVIAALQANGVEIDSKANSQRDLRKVQDAFNQWHDESGRPLTHISQILGYTVGDNIDADDILKHRSRQAV